MKKFLFYALIPCIAVIAVALSVFPERYIPCCLDGIKLWAFTVLPALLPFFFLTLLLTRLYNPDKISEVLAPMTRFLYRSDGVGAFVQIMSFISGYPLGAKLISELYSNCAIDKKEATKMSIYCSTSGPMFVAGSVGAGMLSDKRAGAVLLVCHLLSAVINGIIFRKTGGNSARTPRAINKSGGNVLYDCAYGAAMSCITVGALIAIFYVFTTVMHDLKVTYPVVIAFSALFGDEKKAAAVTAGLIECTKGCFMLAETSGILRLPLICAVISFGGLSVILQSLAFLKNASVSTKFFIFGKIVQSIISFIICLISCTVLGIN